MPVLPQLPEIPISKHGRKVLQYPEFYLLAEPTVTHLVAVVIVPEVHGGGHSGRGGVGVGARVAGVGDGDIVAAGAGVVVVVAVPVVGLVGGRLADRHEGVDRRRGQLRRGTVQKSIHIL